MLTVITPTGERPEAFALCQQWMARQTYSGPVRWFVVDDGRTAQKITFQKSNWDVHFLRPDCLWQPGQNTQGRNLKLALEYVDPATDVVTIVEDDDWYASDWLAGVAEFSQEAELTGEGWAVYYNARWRHWRDMRNANHASLRCTAMRGKAIDTFWLTLQKPKDYYDLQLWQHHEDAKVFPRRHTVGIKGLPGRAGIAVGHDRSAKATRDPDLHYLQTLIGDDADFYKDFYEVQNV
jgi:hypothetical protein